MRNIFKEYKGLDRQMYVMTLTAFINCFGDFIVLFFTLYLTQILDYGVVAAGGLVALLSLVHIPGSLIGGFLCDRYGRKKIMVVSQMIMGVCFLLCGFFLDWRYAPYLIIIGKFFDGITDPAREALEADVTKPEQRQAAFSLLYQVTNIAFAVGPMAAGFLFNKYPKWLFLVSGMAQLVTMCIVIFMVHESLPSPEMVKQAKEQKTAEHVEEGSVWKALHSRPQLIWFSFGVMLTALSYRQVYFSLPIHLDAQFGTSGSTLYGLLLSLNSIIVIVLNPFVLSWSKKHSLVVNLVFASVLYAIGFSLFSFASVPYQFFCIAVVYTIGELVMSNNDQAYRINNTPMNFRGRFSAMLRLFITVGLLAGPLLGGALIERTSFFVLWIVTGLISLAGACCFARLRAYEAEVETLEK